MNVPQLEHKGLQDASRLVEDKASSLPHLLVIRGDSSASDPAMTIQLQVKSASQSSLVQFPGYKEIYRYLICDRIIKGCRLYAKLMPTNHSQIVNVVQPTQKAANETTKATVRDL